MQARQWRGPLSTDPYVKFERYFSHDAAHLERFKNFIAGSGILRDLLASNYFEYLPVKDRVAVTSLFRKIYTEENVYLSYRNRPASVDKLETLKNVDQDSLPESVFIVPVYTVSRATKTAIAILSFFTGIWSSIENAAKAIFRIADFIVSYFTIILVSLPLALISLLSFGSKNVRASVLRVKTLMTAALRPQSKKIAVYLSRYETQFSDDGPRSRKMAALLKKVDLQRILTEKRVDAFAFNDRVLVTSLLRRSADIDPELAYLLRKKGLQDAISVRPQRFVAQLNSPDAKQMSEWQMFKDLKANQHLAPAQEEETGPSSASAARPTRTRAMPNSEAILIKQGWFPSAHKIDLEFATLLRERALDEATHFADNIENFNAMSGGMQRKAAAIMALMRKPFSQDEIVAKIDKTLIIPSTITNRTAQSRADNAFAAALPILYPAYDGESARCPLACWTAAQDALNDETEFSYAAEVLTASYAGSPYNRITDRSISFDTFMITRLEELLDGIRLWVDWEDCPVSALVAYAHAAASVGDRANFNFFISTLDGRAGIPPRFVLNLRDSYFNRGIHNLDAILSPDDAASEDTHLRTIAPGKKYLCLVEMGARVQALRHIGAATGTLTCGPVAPTDAIKFPPGAELIQAEDFIPMYSAEDMEIGTEIDRLTGHYLEHARKTLSTSGISELYQDAVEVTHATVYFALYRDAIAARICEKLVATARKYDGIIMLTKSGQIMGNLIAPAIEAVGRENVYLSLGSHRAPEFFGALTKMRASAKAAKVAPKPIEPSDAWMSPLGTWISNTMNTHNRAQLDVKPGPYAVMTLEHINGYFDSYQALIREGLPHSHVELFTSAANEQLNNHIMEGGFASYEKDYELRHRAMRPRTPDARAWMTPFVQTLRGAFDDMDSPYLPQYRDMLLDRAQAVFAQRLPQIMDAVSYFRARFALGLPDYVFTGPNQHMISRAAAYCAKASGVPVYDFLILANTNHPRYRPIVADYAYLYDPWYKEIYQSFFGMKEEQLRTAGPLFEYNERLKQAPNEDYAAPQGKTHIVFFSQSANFDNSKIMLEAICQATKERKDIYITVKLHPHESPANVERYTQIAADNGIKGNIHVFHKGDAVALLNQADLVVQSFSNIGLDALLLKKPVITFKPKTDLKARIFLYEKDIGFVVRTKTALKNKIKKFLKDPQDRAQMQEIAEKFAAENDHFLRGRNAARVMKSVREDVIRYKAARET